MGTHEAVKATALWEKGHTLYNTVKLQIKGAFEDAMLMETIRNRLTYSCRLTSPLSNADSMVCNGLQTVLSQAGKPLLLWCQAWSA